MAEEFTRAARAGCGAGHGPGQCGSGEMSGVAAGLRVEVRLRQGRLWPLSGCRRKPAGVSSDCLVPGGTVICGEGRGGLGSARRGWEWRPRERRGVRGLSERLQGDGEGGGGRGGRWEGVTW